jgi:hypothetical protein
MATIEVRGNDLELINSWLSLWQGVIGFTSREKELLSLMLIKHSTLSSRGLIEPYLSKELMSTECRKDYCGIMDITNYNLTNLLSSLKDKGILKDNQIDPRLLPREEVTFKFKLDESK